MSVPVAGGPVGPITNPFVAAGGGNTLTNVGIPAPSSLADLLAKVQFSTAMAKSNSVPDYVGNGAASTGSKNVNVDEAFKKSFWDGMGALGQNALNEPVVKGIMDFLSTGTYAAANTASNLITAGHEIAHGDGLKGISDAVMAPVTGVGQGLSAGVAGNDNDKKTFSSVIKQGMDEAGVDSNNTAAKWVQGIGGLVGDIALDPVTYIPGVGIAKAIGGGIHGASDALNAGKAAEAASQVGALADKLKTPLTDINQASTGIGGMVNAGNKGVIQSIIDGVKGGWQAQKDENAALKATKAAQKAQDATPAVDFSPPIKTGDQEINDAVSVPANNIPPEPAVSTAVDNPVDKTEELQNILNEAESKPSETAAPEAAQPLPAGTPAPVPAPVAPPASSDSLQRAIDAISNNKVAEPKELNHSADGLYNDKVHQGMQDIHNDIEFKAPVYTASKLNARKLMEDDAVDKTVEPPAPKVTEETAAPVGEAPKAVSKSATVTTFDLDKFKAKFADLTPQGFKDNWTLSERKAVANATSEKDILPIIKQIRPDIAKHFYTESAPVEKAVEETAKEAPKVAPKVAPKAEPTIIPGKPITPEMLDAAGISAEHHGLSSAELKRLMRPTNDTREMSSYIRLHAPISEAEHVLDKLGVDHTHMEPGAVHAKAGELIGRLEPKYKEVIKGSKRIDKEDAKANKDSLAKALIDQESNSKAEALNAMSVDQTELYRHTAAMQAHADLQKGINLKVRKGDPIQLGGDKLEQMVTTAKQRLLKYQSGNEREFTMPRGDKSHTADRLTGGAVNGGRWEQNYQVELNKAVVAEITDLNKALVKAGGNALTYEAKAKLGTTLVDVIEKDVRAVGARPYANYSSITRKATGPKGEYDQHEAVPLSLGDVMKSLPENVIKEHMYGLPTKAIQSVALTTAAEALYKGVKAGYDDTKLSSILKKILSGDKEGYSPHVNADSTGKGSILKGINFGKNSAIAYAVKRGATKAVATKEYGDMIDSVVKKFIENKNDIYANLDSHVLLNRKMTAARIGKSNAQITTDVSNKIKALAETPMSSMDWMMHSSEIIKNAMKAVEESGDSEQYINLAHALNEYKDSIIPITTQRAAANAKRAAKVMDDPKLTPKEKLAETTKINAESAKDSEDIGKDAILKDEGEESDNPMDLSVAAMGTDLMRKMHRFFSALKPDFGLINSQMYNRLNAGRHTVAVSQNEFHQNLLNAIKKIPNVTETWTRLQREAREFDAGDSGVFASQDQHVNDLYHALTAIYDVRSEHSILATNGISMKELATMAQLKGIHLEHMIDADEMKALKPGDLWKHVNVTGSKSHMTDDEKVLDFISKSYNSTLHLTNLRAIASSFIEKFGSKEAKEGYKKINWTDKNYGNRSTSKGNLKAQKDFGLYEILHSSGMHFDERAAQDIPNLHRLLNESRTLDGALGKFASEVFDPITNVLKTGQTTLRPGHWSSNLMGDMIRNHLAGVSSAKPYVINFKVMKALGHDLKIYGEDPIGAMSRRSAINAGDFGRMEKGGESIKLYIGGKAVNYPVARLARMMDRNVFLPAHGAGIYEDNTLDNPNPATKLARTLVKINDKVTNNSKININKMSAARDNFSRGALAIDHAMKGSWKTEEEMAQAMQTIVRKWAPTSTDFSAFEAKYMRRTMLYYTWLRGMTVRVLDTMMVKPGVATMGNKALYNMAVAGGVNPISIGNPFPVGQMFPSYYYDNILGPQMQAEGGALWGFSPMSPMIDVLNTWGSGLTLNGVANGNNLAAIGKNVANMATPFAKVPTEAFITGESNGIPIKDRAEYIQDQLSGSIGNLISKSTGKELYNPTLGRTDSNNNPANQGAVAQGQLANFLTGMKITNYNSPQAMKSLKGEMNSQKTLAKQNAKR